MKLGSESPNQNADCDWVCFDAECSLCVHLARRFSNLLSAYRFQLVALQTPWVRARVEENGGELLSEMRVITSQSKVYGGVAAFAGIARGIWWAKPVYWLSR